MNISTETPKLKSKNLFTLNRQSNQRSSGYQLRSNHFTSNSSDNESEYQDQISDELTDMRLKIKNLHKKQSLMQGVLSDLENQNELLKQKFLSSEAKTKQIIQKLSKQQVYCKELQYQIQIMEEEFNGEKNSTDSMNRTIAQLALTLKQLVESISQGEQKLYQSLQRVSSMELDINVNDALRFIKSFDPDSKKQVQKLKQQLEHQRKQKKRILPTYNQLLNKMRVSCSVLKDKVDEVYRKADADRQYYQTLISQRDLVIQQLEMKNQKLLIHSRKKQDHDEDEKKMYIGDWRKGLLRKELSQIDREILEIQNNLKEQLKSQRMF